MFTKDVVGCFCHGSVKAIDQGVYFSVLIFKGEEWSKFSSYRCSKNVCNVGVLEFLQTEPDPCAALVFTLWSLKVIITSSWSLPMSAPEKLQLFAMFTLFEKRRLTMIVVVSSWAVPCPASRWFVCAKCVRHLQVVVTGEFYEPQASFVGLRVAILAACSLPVQTCMLSYLCIPVTLHY